MREIRGKKTLVTGVASGIGRALALELAKAGADLFLLDVDEVGLQRTAQEVGTFGVDVITRYCDLSEPAAITAAVQDVLASWGTLDILVNNAGICYYGSTKRMTAKQWDKLLAINLHAPIQLVREFLPTLLARPEAHIVNMASIFGMVVTPRCCAYHVSKFGLVGFSEALRAEFNSKGIGVTAVCPGFVRTNFFSSNTAFGRQEQRRDPPLWVTTTPERVAKCTVRGIRRNRRLVLASWHGFVAYYAKRLAPGLIDWLQQIGRGKKKSAPVEVPSGVEQDDYRNAA